MSDNSAADFMRDQLEALLASPALRRVAERHSRGGDQPAESEPAPPDESLSDRDTEPSIDTQMLRDPPSTRVK